MGRCRVAPPGTAQSRLHRDGAGRHQCGRLSASRVPGRRAMAGVEDACVDRPLESPPDVDWRLRSAVRLVGACDAGLKNWPVVRRGSTSIDGHERRRRLRARPATDVDRLVVRLGGVGRKKKFRDATRLRFDRCVGVLAVVAPACVAQVSLTVEQTLRGRTRRSVVKSRREQVARVFSRASRGLVASGETESHLAVCNEPCSCFSRAGRHLEACARPLEPRIPVPERVDLCYDDPALPDTRS
jgi:hypothetical protein